jgi:hypothetical protein
MRRFLPFAAICLMMTFALVGVRSTLAQSPDANMTGTYTLNETHDGDLTVFARDVTLNASSTVNGNASINALNAVNIHGTINGNLTLLAPTASINLEGMVVNGNLTLCGRSVAGLNNEDVHGTVTNTCDLGALFKNGNARINPVPPEVQENPVLRLLGTGVTAVFVAGLAALVFMFAPGRMNRMIETALRSPLDMGVMGFLTMGVVILGTGIYALLVLLSLGLLCIAAPLVGLFWMVIGLGLILGWIIIAAPIGDWLLNRFHIDASPMVTAVFGAFVMTLAQGVVGMIPCLSLFSTLAVVILGSVGLGTVILTYVGGRNYPEVIIAKAKTTYI